MNNTFENAMSRLEEITKEISEGDVSIDKSLELYAEGVKLINYCNEKLKAVTEKIEEIDNAINKEK